MGSNEEQLKFLLRKNKGKRALEGLKKKILFQTSIKEIDLTSLEQRDLLWEKFLYLLKNEVSRSVFKLDNQVDNMRAKKMFSQLRKSTDRFSCYMFLSHFSDIGGIKIDTSTFFENAITLLEIDSDSIFVMSEDLENGMLLDYYESDNGKGWTYEVIILGHKWSEAFYTLASTVIKESVASENSAIH